MQKNRWYCGCCSGELESQGQVWCDRCNGHVNHGVPFHEGTWKAQCGNECPFAGQKRQ